LDVRRPALEGDAVGELPPEMDLGLVLDGHNALVSRYQPAENAHQRGLPGAGAAGHQHVQAPEDGRLQERSQRRRQETSCREGLESSEPARRMAPDGDGKRARWW